MKPVHSAPGTVAMAGADAPTTKEKARQGLLNVRSEPLVSPESRQYVDEIHIGPSEEYAYTVVSKIDGRSLQIS